MIIEKKEKKSEARTILDEVQAVLGRMDLKIIEKNNAYAIQNMNGTDLTSAEQIQVLNTATVKLVKK